MARNSPVEISTWARPARVESRKTAARKLFSCERSTRVHRGAGGDDAGDFAVDQFLGEARIFGLIADGDAVAFLDQACDVVFRGVIRHAAHRDGLAFFLVAGGERDFELARGGDGVVVEQLVEIAQAEQKQRVGELLLDSVILPHQRRGGGLEPSDDIGRLYYGSMRVRLAMMALVVFAQRSRFAEPDAKPRPNFKRDAEFHFIRTEYTDLPQFHRRWGFASREGRGEGWWIVDWPDADDHFSTGVQRLTRVDTGDPLHFRLTDDRIFNYPWIYATQTGWWGLSEAEIPRLREYLMRGGFLVVDDFWGDEAWQIFQQTMERVLPGHSISILPRQIP